jgi:hypothetical protein
MTQNRQGQALPLQSSPLTPDCVNKIIKVSGQELTSHLLLLTNHLSPLTTPHRLPIDMIVPAWDTDSSWYFLRILSGFDL